MYEQNILEQKRKIIDLVYNGKYVAHLSPAMSLMEIINVLLKDIMHIEAGNLDDEKSDRLVISKGHGSLALYAVYEELGYISEEDFLSFKKMNSKLSVHPDRHKVPGVIVSTGSLGHGLPNAVGIAYAWKIKGKSNKMYVIVGDGELNEGSNWESIIFAARFKVDNLCCIVDNNRSADNMPNMEEKFKAFGWRACTVDGHNEEEIRKALKNIDGDSPYVIIANTIKGKGIKIMEEEHAKWHEKGISDDEYVLIMEDLK
jgi:transketolase